jgi:inorganic pyrophosphatase
MSDGTTLKEYIPCTVDDDIDEDDDYDLESQYGYEGEVTRVKLLGPSATPDRAGSRNISKIFPIRLEDVVIRQLIDDKT